MTYYYNIIQFHINSINKSVHPFIQSEMINKLKHMVQQHSSSSLVSHEDVDECEGLHFANSLTHSNEDQLVMASEHCDAPPLLRQSNSEMQRRAMETSQIKSSIYGSFESAQKQDHQFSFLEQSKVNQIKDSLTLGNKDDKQMLEMNELLAYLDKFEKEVMSIDNRSRVPPSNLQIRIEQLDEIHHKKFFPLNQGTSLRFSTVETSDCDLNKHQRAQNQLKQLQNMKTISQTFESQ